MLRSLLRGRAISGGFIAFAVAAAVTASALSPALGTGPEGVTSFSGTSSGAIVTSHNSGTGQAISASGSTGASTGVIYATTAAAGSTAIRGYSTSTSATPSYGVIGVSKNGYGVEALTYSPSSLALFAYNVATSGGAIKGQSAGNAITGISAKANGVVGDTGFGIGSLGVAGVLGRDHSLGGINSGVHGTSTNGLGVLGDTSSGIAATGVQGVLGRDLSTSGSINSGVYGLSTNGNGVQGYSTNSTGVFGSSPNGGGGVQGVSTSNNGVEGDSTSGNGVVGFSTSDIGVVAGSSSDTQPALEAGSGSGSGTPSASVAVVEVAFAKTQSCGGVTQFDIFTIDQKGDVKACGTITASTTPLVIRRTTLGQHLVSYAAQQSQPTIEDFGQGRLVNGQVYVPLESRFAVTIDPRANYLVFLTPEDDNRGLYVTQKTPRGFVVRESQGGRSTLAFDYRIVAKPYDTNAPRLPLASSLPHPRPVTLPLLRNETRFHRRPPM